MLARILNNQKWDALVKANSSNQVLVNIIERFLKPDMIDPVKYFTNYKVIAPRFEERVMLMEQFPGSITSSMGVYENGMNSPRGYNPWYIAAYPDVANWYSKNIDDLEQEPSFADLFEEDETFDERVFDNGVYRPEILRRFIDYYKKVIGDRLECSVG